MARKWERVYFLDSELLGDGRDELPYYWCVSSMRYPLRDREYRLAWDPKAGKWAVFIRLGTNLKATPGHGPGVPGDYRGGPAPKADLG